MFNPQNYKKMKKYTIYYKNEKSEFEKWEDADIKTEFNTSEEAENYVMNIEGAADVELFIFECDMH